MKKSMLISLATAAILLAASPSYCTTYYVATTGSDSYNGTSLATPFLTIGKGVSTAAAGDTVYVRAGTYSYTGSSTAITLGSKSGASSTNMTYLMGYNGERPFVDFSAMTGTSAQGLQISGNYWYVKGFDFKGAPHSGIKFNGGSYNTVEFCTSYENRNAGVQLGGGAANNLIKNCDSYHNYDPQNSGGDADGFSPKLDVGTGNYFYGCRSWGNSDDGFDGYLRPSDDVTTTYENCWSSQNGWYWKDGTTTSSMNGNGFKMGGSDSKNLRHNAILKNCLSFNNKSKGFDQNNDLGSMTLYNCTAFNNGGYNFYITLALASGKVATVKNCVSDGATGISLAGWVVQATNNFSAGNSNFISVDPTAAYGSRKADGSLPDITFMHLAAGSSLIDSGTNVGLPDNDNDGKWDLGCFEYMPSDITPPTPNPMTFATAPYGASATSVSMVATTATDASGVEYMFTCTAGAGHSSAWQSGTSYTDTGLMPSTSYTYTVTARDLSSSHNTTAASSPASGTTLADTTAPTPNPMTFSTAPYGASSTSVAMVATTATDISGVEYMFTCTAGGGHSSAWQSSTSYTDTGLMPSTTYTYTVKARDLSTARNVTAASSPASASTQADTTPPTPSPMSFATAPYGASEISISMVATLATDIAGVEYMFTCTAGGGHSSAWQNSTSYTDTGLTPSTTYTYTVKARDKSVNHTETLPSSPASAATLADTTAPTPDPMTWAVEPNATGIDTITMTATTAADISGVEYYFANVTDPNHDSAWQDSASYADTGLMNNMTYVYRVIARDKSAAQNETGWSSEVSATTPRFVCTGQIPSDLDGNCQVDFMDFALIGNTWTGDEAAWAGVAQFATDWLVCNRNPAGECWQ